MAGLEGIGFRLMTLEDEAAVRGIFYEEIEKELLNIGLGISRYDWKVPLDQILSDILGNGLSNCAFDTKTGDIIGIRMCTLTKKGDPTLRREHPVFDINNPETKKVALLELIWKSLHDEIDIFEIYQADVFLQFYGLYVKESYGRRGIGRRLVEEALRHHVVVTADSNYSFSIFKNLNFEQVSEKYFDDMYENGEHLIKHDTGEHKRSVLMVTSLGPYVAPE